MGVVYIAHDTDLDRRVAIKVQSTDTGSERFLIAARVGQRATTSRRFAPDTTWAGDLSPALLCKQS